jgi:putative endonuclease
MWYTYLLQCAKGLYCGITIDVNRREIEHNTPSKQALSVRMLGTPAVMVYCEEHPDRKSAAKREYAIKQLKATKKRELITSELNVIHKFK